MTVKLLLSRGDVYMGSAHGERSPTDCWRLLLRMPVEREGSERLSACSVTALAAALASG